MRSREGTTPLKGEGKRKQRLAPKRAAALLRRLADAIEQAGLGGELPLTAEGQVKIRESSRRTQGRQRYRLELELRGPRRDRSRRTRAASKAKRPRYKELKKRMQRDLRDIGRALRRHAQPEAELVERFCADAERMTDYPRRGEPHYPAFLAGVQAMLAAHAAGDLGALEQAVDALKAQRKACHARYA